MTILQSAVRGLSWSASATLFKGAIQLAQLIIVARFFSAYELGLLALIYVVLGLAQIFGDAGLSNATIYFRDLSKSRLRQ